MMVTIHDLKTDPEPFAASMRGDKNFEVRNNDRGYKHGDYVTLEETEHPCSEMDKGMPLRYTGRVLSRVITHVQSGYGLPDGLVVLGLCKI